MAKINLNVLAIAVSHEEGKKKETDIAQIKEVIKITFEKLALFEDAEIVECIRRGRG